MAGKHPECSHGMVQFGTPVCDPKQCKM